MIVYIYFENYFKKTFLPNKIFGVYPIYDNKDRIIANVEAIDGKWYIKNSPDVLVYKDSSIESNPELTPYNTYILKLKNNQNFFLIATPIYSKNSVLLSCKSNSFTCGSDNNNSIIYNNPYVIGVNFKLTRGESGWTIQSANKNVYVNDKLVSSKELYTGDYIFIQGLKIICLNYQFMIVFPPNNTCRINPSVFLTTVVPENGDSTPTYEILDDLPLYDNNSYFSKAPRFISNSSHVDLKIDPPPNPDKNDDTPVILTVGPQLTMMMGSVFSASTVIVDYANGDVDLKRFITSILLVSTMLAGVIIWPFITRLYQKRFLDKKEKKRQKKYKEYLNKKLEDIKLIKAHQKEVMIENTPSLQICSQVIQNKKSNLWERNIEHNDFLKLCLGIGTVDADIKIDSPEEHFSIEDKDALLEGLDKVIEESKYIDDCPFTLSLTENNLLAIIGEKELSDRFIDNLFLQIMAFHAYSDLKIIVFSNKENASRWEYLKILPHCWDNQHNTRYFSSTIEEFNEIIQDIEKTFELRRAQDEDSKVEDTGDEKGEHNRPIYYDYKPYYLIFTDDINAIKNTALIKNVFNYKKNLGFSVIIENDRLSTLPDQTKSFISVSPELSGLINNKIDKENKNQFKVDFTTPINMYRAAQTLANVPILLEKGKYELPTSLTFLEMYNVGRVEQLNSLDRWRNNNPVNSLSVPIGIDQNGEIFKMDIHEKFYGPHGLVAGTTGSGKSEWIITYILSLAVNFNPDEVQFVLIDYKGGGLAMSFENKEMGIKLPHLAGTITNLNKSAISRAIASIESELKRRQSVFNEAREKLKESQMDIYKYQQYYRKGLVDKPMSHLLIISDEFAELKAQQPEFMEQLISTSRIGRSLGVHLILATQKPSGVVNDQIWSNSKFKVCLKVQDKTDSNEILKKPDAAFLKQTGAFYLEVGTDDYYNLGQSAWAGAKYYPSDVITKQIDQSVQYIDNTGRIVSTFDDVVESNVSNEASHGEELLNIVNYLDKLDKNEEFVKPQLWLANIPENIYLDDIKKKYNHKFKYLDFETVIGEYDEPRAQVQGQLTLNLADGNIAIVGQTGAGKEALLSTIMYSSVLDHTPQELNYYVLDFGAETLKKFARFPHVGEVAFQDDMERVGAVIQLVLEEMEKRKSLFQDYNGSFELYNSKNPNNVLPLICLVINGYDVFSEQLLKLSENLMQVYRESARYGIIFILSATTQNTFRPRILQYFNRFIVMNLQDESQYRTLTNCRKGLIPTNCYGRGICKVNDDDDSYAEFQTAFICKPDEEVELLRAVTDKLLDHYTTKAKKIVTIPDNVTSQDLVKYVTNMENVPIGYNFYEKDICKINLSSSKFYSVITKDLSKNIKFIYALADLLTKIPDTVVRVIDVLNIFQKPILDIKLFQDNLEVITTALRNDIKSRTDTQPLAINIIIGIGSLPSKLSKNGKKTYDELFNGISSSKQNIYILVDDYNKFKTLKLQPWFSSVDTSKGIWLGEGIQSQSVLITNDLTDEDAKYNFEGMAYLIEDGKYNLVKTMMDGDD